MHTQKIQCVCVCACARVFVRTRMCVRAYVCVCTHTHTHTHTILWWQFYQCGTPLQLTLATALLGSIAE